MVTKLSLTTNFWRTSIAITFWKWKFWIFLIHYQTILTQPKPKSFQPHFLGGGFNSSININSCPWFLFVIFSTCCWWLGIPARVKLHVCRTNPTLCSAQLILTGQCVCVCVCVISQCSVCGCWTIWHHLQEEWVLACTPHEFSCQNISSNNQEIKKVYPNSCRLLMHYCCVV